MGLSIAEPERSNAKVIGKIGEPPMGFSTVLS